MVDYEQKGLFCHKCGRNFEGRASSLSNHVRSCPGINDDPKLGSSVNAGKAQKRDMERTETSCHEDGTARISFLKKRRTTILSENPAADDSDDSDDQDTGGCNFEDPADVYFRSEANGDLNSYGSDGAPSPDNSQKSEAYDQNEGKAKPIINHLVICKHVDQDTVLFLKMLYQLKSPHHV